MSIEEPMKTKVEVSPALRQFLIEYYIWLLKGANVRHKSFSRKRGLCGNLHEWKWNITNSSEMIHKKEMAAVIRALWGGRSFPFCSEREYWLEARESRCHLNKKRIAFVKKMVNSFI